MIVNDENRNFVRPGYIIQPVLGFRDAPFDWSREHAEEVAHTEGLTLTPAHWEVVRTLQELCTRNEKPTMNARDLHDALDKRFHDEGGIKHLYELFPKGPLAQGCLLAGLQPPAGTQDQGMGSAV
ncbi:MAG: TusE/DsrC/DsvC family sulfur relay protein [Rhizobium sp.]|jgi:tRNA 2-thiouridine synthesizing protein E|uniref:TusE/DsrC/DsvC family sulfur relay protein n=1 Tax=Thiobacillus sp. TaxID=924 RepID=UPI0025F27696|nr:TusE/DsrC/DsvC family sulfur relay protein [Thiobacillus sp.]MBW8365938.1 TusE/DsrC/DsvC family sulfur relay protein [Rhizobium sp.]